MLLGLVVGIAALGIISARAVLEQQRGLSRHTQVPRVGNLTPLVDVPANLIHRVSYVILKLGCGKALSFVEGKLLLA